MNSLKYLVASARTPPSTPTSEQGNPIPRSRSQTWNKFFFPPRQPRRSYSSPAIAITSTQDEKLHMKASSKLIVESSSPRRSFIARVLVLAWKVLCAAWTSLSRSELLERQEDIATPHLLSEKAFLPPNDPGSPNVPSRSPSHPPIPPNHRSHTESSLLPTELQHLSSNAAFHPSSVVASSRTPTPTLTTRKSPFHLPKTLVLDLDETLIHSTSRPIHSDRGGWFGFRKKENRPEYTVEVMLGGRTTLYHVYKRPFADFFLRTVSSWYTLVIFTASMKEYADPVIDWLDGGRGILARRHFRDSCTQLPNGSYTKDLSIVEDDLSRVCLVDNSPISYRVNEANGIPIEGWTHDPSDEALLDLLPVLDSLRFTSDVRRVLGLRCAGQS